MKVKVWKNISNEERNDIDFLEKMKGVYEKTVECEDNEDYLKIVNNISKIEDKEQLMLEKEHAKLVAAQEKQGKKIKLPVTDKDKMNEQWLLNNIVFLSNGLYSVSDECEFRNRMAANDYYGQYQLNEVDGNGHVSVTSPIDRIKSNENKLCASGGLAWMPVSKKDFKIVDNIDGQMRVNTYKPYDIDTTVEGDCSKWVELVRFICGEYADLVMDHMAFTLQYPEKKIIWQIMIYDNTTRNGKTAMLKPMMEFLGKLAGSMDQATMEAGWGDAFYKKKVVVFEEVFGLERKQFNSIKTKFANTDVESLNIKGGGMIRQANRYSMYLLSNHADALQMDVKEDKLLVIQGPGTYIKGNTVVNGSESDVWYSELWDWYNDGGFSNVANFLLNRDVSEFKNGATPVRTAALEKMCSEAAPSYEVEVMEMIEDGRAPFNRKGFKLKDLMTRLSLEGYVGISQKGVQRILRKQGFDNTIGQKYVDGKRPKIRFWAKESDVIGMSVSEKYDVFYENIENIENIGEVKNKITDIKTKFNNDVFND